MRSIQHFSMSTFFRLFWNVVYKHHIFLCDFHLLPNWLLLSDSSCSICCNSCGVISKADIAEKNSTSIFTPLCFQFNILNVLSSVDANSLGETVSHCLYLSFVSFVLFFASYFRKRGCETISISTDAHSVESL